MSRIKCALELISTALVAVVVAGMLIGPEIVAARMDEAFLAWWRTAGDHLAGRELNAIARQLDYERREYERLAALREKLNARVQSLELRTAPRPNRMTHKEPRTPQA